AQSPFSGVATQRSWDRNSTRWSPVARRHIHRDEHADLWVAREIAAIERQNLLDPFHIHGRHKPCVMHLLSRHPVGDTTSLRVSFTTAAESHSNPIADTNLASSASAAACGNPSPFSDT